MVALRERFKFQTVFLKSKTCVGVFYFPVFNSTSAHIRKTIKKGMTTKKIKQNKTEL